MAKRKPRGKPAKPSTVCGLVVGNFRVGNFRVGNRPDPVSVARIAYQLHRPLLAREITAPDTAACDECRIYSALYAAPIAVIKDVRAELLASAKEITGDLAKGGRWPRDGDERQERAREMRAAAWLCQVEINKHNAFMKRQSALAL